MSKMINRYDNMLEKYFEQENSNVKFNIEKDLPEIVAQYEKIVKPDFLYVLNLRDPNSRLVFEKNYTLESDKGKVDFELLMQSIPEKELSVLLEIDAVSIEFVKYFFKRSFQYIMNVALPIELNEGKPKCFLRSGTIMSFDNGGVPEYSISFFKDVTALTGVKKTLNYYISSNEKPNEDLKALSKKFDTLLKNKLLLSTQERRVLKYVMIGKTSKSIAAELFISKFTVDTHRQNIIKKLKVSNTNEAIQKALELGIIN